MKKILILLAICTLISCKSKLKPREMGAFEYKTTCVSNQNGSLIVMAWGMGSTKKICEENALKKAISDVVFKGIKDGNQACQSAPILGKVSAEKDYQDFFATFLSDNGKFREYAQIYDEPRSQNRSKKIRKLDRVENLALEFQITVDRKGLAKLLSQESILKNSQNEN